MLSDQEKQMIKAKRLKEYEVRLYDLSLQKAALEAVESKEADTIDQRIKALEKAYAAVEAF